jgi:LuxR family transcriptional regulator, maltose regulon positive regulatory protein
MRSMKAGSTTSGRSLEAPAPLEPNPLEIPAQRPGSIQKTALVNRLRASAAGAVVTLVAPAGYGKTTVLAQWAERDERSFAWVPCDEDDDALGLCIRIASALERAGSPVESAVTSIRSRRSLRPALRDLASILASLRAPVVLALDGVHILRSKGCGEVLAALALDVPRGSTVVLAGRSLPRGPVATLRARGGLHEVGIEELVLTRRDAEKLLRGLEVEVEQREIDELVNRAEGWPAGVYLAALALKDGRPGMVVPGGDDRFVSDYLDFELLSRLSAKDVSFLTRTSVLDALSGPLCDAVLESEGSGRRLEALERDNLFLIPLDRRRWSYRYHRDFRDFLRAELERREPQAAASLCARASVWCEKNDEPEAAIAYAHAAGDVDRLARLVGRHTLAAWAAGKRDAVETWLGWFDETSDLERHPEIAALEAWVHGLAGRPSASERWLRLAERATPQEPLPDGSASIEPWLAVVRATQCQDGVERMQADAELALRKLGPASGWRPSALVLRGAAHLLLGEDDLADAALAEAAEEAESIGVAPSRIVALSERSLLAAARGDEARSGELALEARALVEEHGLEKYVRSALAFAVSARREAHCGNLDRARLELRRAEALTPQLTRALPWYSVQSALELAQVNLSLLDVTGARAWLALADEILLRRPLLGILVARRAELGAQVDRVAAAHEGRTSTLTAAELRLLPLLATYLSFREIGEHLFVSRNTVKTQAISVYRKLGVSSRSEAIERAGELGLVDRAA